MEAAKLYKYLPAGITWLIERLPPDIQGHINEIRLRRNGVLSVSLPEQNLVIQSGKGAYICTDRDIDETVAYISRSSMYAFDGAVRNTATFRFPTAAEREYAVTLYVKTAPYAHSAA